MTARCRQFQAADADACSGIIRAGVESDSAVPQGLRELLLARETPSRMMERASLYYIAVCEIGAEIVGLGGLDLNEIRLLVVLPSRQRQGCGRLLLQHLEGMVPPAFFRDIFLYSAPAAEGFYRTCGFVSGGGHTTEVDGYPVPTVFMTKALCSTDPTTGTSPARCSASEVP